MLWLPVVRVYVITNSTLWIIFILHGYQYGALNSSDTNNIKQVHFHSTHVINNKETMTISF